jgi:hypothetical protein
MSETESLNAVLAEADCDLLLDVNNIYVNAVNLGLDAERYIAGVPRDAVREIHLAGHLRKQVGERTLLIDDHGSAVHPDVWRLYELALQRFGPVPTLIEWDTDVPALEVLVAEARLADRCLERVRERAA